MSIWHEWREATGKWEAGRVYQSKSEGFVEAVFLPNGKLSHVYAPSVTGMAEADAVLENQGIDITVPLHRQEVADVYFWKLKSEKLEQLLVQECKKNSVPIPVANKESPPPKHERVLAWNPCSRHWCIAHLSDEGWIMSDQPAGRKWMTTVSHWLPLPPGLEST